jgi:hypothetical protein
MTLSKLASKMKRPQFLRPIPKAVAAIIGQEARGNELRPFPRCAPDSRHRVLPLARLKEQEKKKYVFCEYKYVGQLSSKFKAQSLNLNPVLRFLSRIWTHSRKPHVANIPVTWHVHIHPCLGTLSSPQATKTSYYTFNDCLLGRFDSCGHTLSCAPEFSFFFRSSCIALGLISFAHLV